MGVARPSHPSSRYVPHSPPFTRLIVAAIVQARLLPFYYCY